MIEKELVELRREIQSELVNTEARIFDLESKFFEEVALNGSLLLCSCSCKKLGVSRAEKHF